jgi:hypothetical protein
MCRVRTLRFTLVLNHRVRLDRGTPPEAHFPAFTQVNVKENPLPRVFLDDYAFSSSGRNSPVWFVFECPSVYR